MTLELLAEVHRRIYSLSSDAFSDTQENFHERRGRVKELNNLLNTLEAKKAEILGNTRQDIGEDEDDE